MDPQAEPLVKTESSPPTAPEGISDLLLDELRDIPHAEKQLTKALPRMAKAARFDRLREYFEEHLIETEGQIERLNECFSLLGENARAKACKGMMGLVEEGQEVMAVKRRKTLSPTSRCSVRRNGWNTTRFRIYDRQEPRAAITAQRNRRSPCEVAGGRGKRGHAAQPDSAQPHVRC